jgi:lipopolysaccharide export LptBFGC system permease protein LptF
VLPQLLPIALSYSIPFSWLTALALVMGRWVADHEKVAIQASGVHLRVIVVPVLALGCALAVLCMFLTVYWVPRAHRETRASLKDFLPKFLASLKGTERTVNFTSGRLSFDRWDSARQAFVAVEMDRRDQRGRLAEKAVMESLRLQQVGRHRDDRGLLLDLERAYIITAPGGNVEVESFGTQVPFVMGRVERVGASTLFNEFFGQVRFLHRPRDMVLSELAYAVERGGVARGSVQEARIALHGRLALGGSAFFLGLFALAVVLVLPPTGRRVRDFMLCFLPAILLFFPLHITGPSIARGTPAPPWLAMWAPNLVLAAVASVLLWRAFRR